MTSESFSLLQNEFDSLGIRVSEHVLQKCVELCTLYRISAETLVEQWTAFSVSCLNGAEPTVDFIAQLERKYLQKMPVVSSTTRSSKTKVDRLQQQINESLLSDISILEEYGVSTNFNQTSLVTENKDVFTNLKIILSHKSVYTIGNLTKKQWKKINQESLDIKLQSNTRFMYMNELLTVNKEVQCQQTDHIAKYLLKKYQLKDLFTFIEVSSEPFLTYGRIINEDFGNKDVYLEGSFDFGPTQNAYLDLSQLSGDFSLFSGQVVVLEVICLESDVLIAKKAYYDASLPVRFYEQKDLSKLTPLQFIVVAGPYIILDANGEISLKVFHKLVNFIEASEPDVLIMMGPFFDTDQDNFHKLTELKHLFEKMIFLLIEQTNRFNLEIFIIPSHNELNHINVYPTQPFHVPTIHNKNVHFLPNPALIDINGILIGINNVDILFEMSKHQIASNSSSVDRISRFISHLIEQQSFYPIYPYCTSKPDAIKDDINSIFENRFSSYKPPPAIDSVFIQSSCRFDTYTPHILILPSTFQHFAKIVKDTFALNPSKCCRQKTDTTVTVARFLAFPGAESIAQSVNCEVVQL